MGLSLSIERIKQVKTRIKHILIEKETGITDFTRFEEYPDYIKNIGNANDIEESELLTDRILGSEEEDTALRNSVIEMSATCDDIIGKENTSSVYSEIELDTLDELELKADEIIGE